MYVCMYVDDHYLLGTVGFVLSSSLGGTTGGEVRSATYTKDIN